MKRVILLMLALSLLLLCACSNTQQGNGDFAFTAGNDSPADTVNQEEEDSFYFLAGDVAVRPGMPFDVEDLPTENVYQVPSCAFEGTDNVYGYGSYEITAFGDANGETVYSIYLIEPDVSTPEGLSNGDEMTKAAELYGSYEEDGTAWVFTRGKTQLFVIGQDGIIVSIEMRLVA